METTLVSAFCDLQKHQKVKREKDTAFYFKNGIPILEMEVPMILFIEPELVENVRTLREKVCKSAEYVEKTCIIPFTLEDSPYFIFKEELDQAYKQGMWPDYLGEDGWKDTPGYASFTWTKPYFMQKASESNPFHSSRFLWVDLGVFYLPYINTHIKENQEALYNILRTIPEDKITCLAIHGIHQLDVNDRSAFYKVWNSRTAGGLLGGGTIVLSKFAELFDKELRWCLDNKHYVNEQPIYSALRAENRELFSVYYGDYRDIFTGYEKYTLNSHMGKQFPMLQLKTCFYSANYVDIIDIATRLLEIFPSFGVKERDFILDCLQYAYETLGDYSHEQFLLEKKFENMEESSSEINKDWWICIQLAKKYKKRGNIDKFIENCEKAWHLNQNLIEPILELIKYYQGINNYKKSFDYATRALNAGIKDPNLEESLKSYFERMFDVKYIEEGSSSLSKIWWVCSEMAKIYKQNKRFDKFVSYYERAWEEYSNDPNPMIELSTYFLSINDRNKAYAYAKKAKDARLVHPELDRLLMITAYYAGDMYTGREACDNLALTRSYPTSYKNQGNVNLFWYSQVLPHIKKLDLKDIVDIPIISDVPTQKYKPLNPCILPKKDGSGYYINCRLVNYYQDTVTGAYTIYDKENIIRTKNIFLELDNSLNVISQHELVDKCVDFTRCRAMAVGLEDMRLFWYDDEILFSATSLEVNGSPTIAMGAIQHVSPVIETSPVIEHYVHMQKPNPARQEKNWIPFVTDDAILSIYSFDPFIVLKCDIQTGEIGLVSNTSQAFDMSNLRGSSGLIVYEDGYLTVAHQITVFNNRRYYFHRFLYFEIDDSTDPHQYVVRKLSRPFYFIEKDVEFCSGMVYSPSKSSVFLTIGLKDREAYLFEVTTDYIKEMLTCRASI